MRAYLIFFAACCASLCGATPEAAFGLRLRPAPREVTSIWAPTVLRAAPTNEACLVGRRDGVLELYAIAKPAGDAVTVCRSRDGGLTWSDAEVAFPLAHPAYYAIQVLESADGSLHAVTHNLGAGPGGYRGKLYEVYYASKSHGAAAWSTPRRIVPGYVGSIRGFIQLRPTGRLVLAVARAIPEREAAPKSGPDFGWNDTFVYYSDDLGATWRQSPDQLSLELANPNATRYGAIEPTLLELRDGRVWMLVRDRGGRLWESISATGERWPPLARSGFISSDSPATLLRLRDGKIVLFTNACQDWSNPRSYAMGGREVLHAAISADDGKTWRGFREVLHEPTTVTRGDRGTAYASAAENAAGKVVVVSGQGEDKRALFAFDPRWLEETSTRDDLRGGPVGWTQYGAEGLRLEADAVAIPLAPAVPGGALWNFPMADAGAITLRIQIPAAASAARLCLTDHFNRIDDRQAGAHSVFDFDAAALADDRPHEMTLTWKDATHRGELSVVIDGRAAVRLTAQRPAQFGVNYLRCEFRAAAFGGSVLVSHLAARGQE